jgi:hypothetical protein
MGNEMGNTTRYSAVSPYSRQLPVQPRGAPRSERVERDRACGPSAVEAAGSARRANLTELGDSQESAFSEIPLNLLARRPLAARYCSRGEC